MQSGGYAACGAGRRGRLANVRTFVSEKTKTATISEKILACLGRGQGSRQRMPARTPNPGLDAQRTSTLRLTRHQATHSTARPLQRARRLHLSPAFDPGRGSIPHRRIRMLKAKVAVVTGSTSGIGLGIATAFAQHGADIVLHGFGDAAEIEKVRAGLASEHGVRVLYDG